MTASATVPVLLGLDGLAACVALRLLGLNPRVVPLAVWCGLCDGLALVVGAAFPLPPFAASGAWPVLIPVGAAFAGMVLIWRMKSVVVLLPILLALDNFLFGIGIDQTVGIGNAAVSGMVSAAFAAAGLLSGGMIVDRFGGRHARLAGFGILLATGLAGAVG